VKLYSKTEPIDDNWTIFINCLKDNLHNILSEESELYETDNNEYYSKILAYIPYRHLIKAVFDGCIVQRVCFCVESVRFIMLCDKKHLTDNKKIDTKAYINNLKNWSKQVEYSEENTELLIFGEETDG
jgi:lysine-N-methylase